MKLREMFRRNVNFAVTSPRIKCITTILLLTVLTVPGYDVRVNRQPVMEGCNAVLSCTAREDVKEHLTVTSWFRDDAILLPGNTDTGE